MVRFLAVDLLLPGVLSVCNCFVRLFSVEMIMLVDSNDLILSKYWMLLSMSSTLLKCCNITDRWLVANAKYCAERSEARF